MDVCANCGHKNRPGILFCENCGTSLTGQPAAGSTKGLDDVQPELSEQIAKAGTDYFAPGSALRVEIEGGPEPITIQPRQEIIFGRRDPATGAMPDIDLTPYAGYRMGVSRRHAAIRAAEENHLDVWDLGSSNGTFLNGVRLNPHRPYRLHDGDRIRLGQMVIRILYQPPQDAVAGEPSLGLRSAIATMVDPVLAASDEPAPKTRNADDLEAAVAEVLGALDNAPAAEEESAPEGKPAFEGMVGPGIDVPAETDVPWFAEQLEDDLPAEPAATEADDVATVEEPSAENVVLAPAPEEIETEGATAEAAADKTEGVSAEAADTDAEEAPPLGEAGPAGDASSEQEPDSRTE